MKNSIQLPTQNIYEVKSQEFYKSRLAQRLKEKYTPKPFEESYKPVYWIALVTSYLCNLFSILTASTFVCSYLFSIMKELPYPLFWAFLFTGFVLILIETLQRILAPRLFKNALQYGFKISSIVLVTIIVTLSSLSVIFSYKGGFDVVDKFATAPVYNAPTLIDIEAIRKEYQNLILSASNDAEEWKQTKKWKGRLSDSNAKVYANLLDEKAALKTAMIAKINEADTKNEALLNNAKADYQNALQSHKSNIFSKGGGLAKFAIIAQFLFFGCIFFVEYFDYKTASQYALFSNPTVINNYQVSSLSNTPINHNGNNKAPIARNQIGFKTNPSKQSKSQLEQAPTASQTIILQDKRTIEHNGKYYTLSDVNNFINIYQKRVNEAQEKGKESIAANRRTTLEYWQDRKEELINQISNGIS